MIKEVSTNTSTTCVGNVAEKVAFATAEVQREGIYLHNADLALNLYAKPAMPDWTVVPATFISSTDKVWCLLPGETAFLPLGAGIEVWVMNSAGDATSSSYCATEAF